MGSMLTLTDTKLAVLLLNRFKGAVKGLTLVNQSVIFVPEENALRVRAERSENDQVEFISFWRTDTQFDWVRSKTGAAMHGLYTNMAGTDYQGQKAVPVLLTYEIIYWTREKRNSNDFMEQAAFWVHGNPRLFFTCFSQELPNGLDIHIKNMSETVESWFENSRLYKVHLQITVDGWVFKNVDVAEITEIDLDIYMDNNTGINPVLVAHDVIVPTP